MRNEKLWDLLGSDEINHLPATQEVLPKVIKALLELDMRLCALTQLVSELTGGMDAQLGKVVLAPWDCPAWQRRLHEIGVTNGESTINRDQRGSMAKYSKVK